MNDKEISESAFIEYLKMIQNVINRIAKNTFMIKTWTTTIIAGILILTFSLLNIVTFIMLLGIVIMFWILDSYYLRLERLYRKLYNHKVDEYYNSPDKNSVKLFDMDYSPYQDDEKTIIRTMISKSEIFYYSPFIVIFIVLFMAN